MEYTKLKTLDFNQKKGLFILDDDFTEIRNTYFKDLFNLRSWKALPGGVQDSYTPFYHNFPEIKVSQEELAGYKIDTDGNLDYIKEQLIPLLSKWENRNISINEFTLCPSVSNALLTCFNFIKTKKITNVVHETPAFFASVEQSKKLNFESILYPTKIENEFCMKHTDVQNLNNSISPYALVVSQPKVGTGFNRRPEDLKNLISSINKDSFLIIDEAADRTFPSLTSNISVNNKKILRVKSLFKGLGFNGIRAAIIFHSEEYKSDISSILEIMGGSLDSYSIKMILQMTKHETFYQTYLDSASKYLNEGSQLLKNSLRGSLANYQEIENGYLGIVRIPFNKPDFFIERKKLLNEAKKLQTPLVLGSSMYFPYDGSGEWVRFNFFTSKDNILKSANILDRLSIMMQK